MKKSVEELARLFGGKVIGDGAKKISGVASADQVGPEQMTFAENEIFLKTAEARNAGVIVVPASIPTSSCTLIQVPNPRVAFAKSLDLFFPLQKPEPGIHETAVIAEGAQIAESASIGAYVVVEEGAQIGEGVVIGPQSYVGKEVVIEANTFIYPQVTLYSQTRIGKNVIVHSGVVLGSDGFGYADDGEKRIKIRQLGVVVIEDDVEIGANSCVDRGTLGATTIRKGTKIDNLVQVAHNDDIGENVLLCAQVGISGSAKVGKNAILAGQVGIGDHVQIGEYSIVGAKCGVPTKKKVPPKSMLAGYPSQDIVEWREATVVQRRMPKVLKSLQEKIAALETKVSELQSQISNQTSSKI